MTDQAHWAIILKQKIFWVGTCSDWLLNPYVLLLRTCAYHLVRNVKKRTQALSKKHKCAAIFCYVYWTPGLGRKGPIK